MSLAGVAAASALGDGAQAAESYAVGAAPVLGGLCAYGVNAWLARPRPAAAARSFD